MNRIKQLFILVITFFILGGGIISAKETLDIPSPQGFVNDFEGIFGNDAQSLESYLENIYEETGVEIAVVTVDNFEGYDIETFASKLFEEWGIGNEKVDNGILIIVSVKQRQARVEVGYGLEEVLPDSYVGLVEEKYLVPAFKQGQYVEGIKATVEQLMKRIGDDDYVLSEEDAGNPGLAYDQFKTTLIVTTVLTIFFTLLFSDGDKLGLQGLFIGLFFAFLFAGTLSINSASLILFYFVIEGLAGMLTSLFVYYLLGRKTSRRYSHSTSSRLSRSRHYYSSSWGSSRSYSSGSSGGSSFSFGGGSSGGGGASVSW